MTSAVAEHCNEKNHKFDVLQNAKILEVVRINRVIDTLESLYTHDLALEINRDKGIIPSSLYNLI